MKKNQKNYGGHFDIDTLKQKVNNLEEKTKQANFWNDRQQAEKIIKELNDEKSTVDSIEQVLTKVKDDLELVNLLEIENDEESIQELEQEIVFIEQKTEEVNLLLLLNGPYDKNDCTLEIHPGAGGTESCDWALILYRMYTRWCEKKKYKVEVLDYQDGDEAGIKSVMIRVKGNNAYGYLKNDKGVHRLV